MVTSKTYTLTIELTESSESADADGNTLDSLLETEFQNYLEQLQWKKSDAKIRVTNLQEN